MSWKSGSLTLLEPSGTHRVCYGTALHLTFFHSASTNTGTLCERNYWWILHRGADKSLVRPGRKKLQRKKILIFIYPMYNDNCRNINTIYIYNKTSISWSVASTKAADKSLVRPGRKKLQRKKILIFIYTIYNHNWRNISTIYTYNKTSIKRNILTIKQKTSGSRSG
jgi:predicted transcriptional regulator with HTH domain